MNFETLREASRVLAGHNSLQKNHALSCVAQSLEKNRTEILNANKKDLGFARSGGMSEALLERLALDDKKIDGIISGIKTVIEQKDPIGEVQAGWKTEIGLQIKQVRVPLGVVAIIYESRPNVTVDAFCLAYKSGNAILLRGSSSAVNSNISLLKAIKDGLKAAGADGVIDAVQLVESPAKDHSDVDEILGAVGKIDCVLPRGGEKLIRNVVENAKVPVIQTGSGVCHLFVDESADFDMAARIAENAKIQRPGACNAIECILVHAAVAERFLPVLENKLAGRVELRCDEKSIKYVKNGIAAKDADFGFEFLDLIMTVKVVADVKEAISYINSHNTQHSESIITNDRENARLFQNEIDAACVYVNASTRFTDGGMFGFGAELGISTQKLHARGPMGISALTTTKFLIDGDGEVR